MTPSAQDTHHVNRLDRFLVIDYPYKRQKIAAGLTVIDDEKDDLDNLGAKPGIR